MGLVGKSLVRLTVVYENFDVFSCQKALKNNWKYCIIFDADKH